MEYPSGWTCEATVLRLERYVGHSLPRREMLLGHVHARPLPPPELLVAAAHDRFDPELRLTHEGTRRVLSALLERFARWIERDRIADAAERALASPASAHR